MEQSCEETTPLPRDDKEPPHSGPEAVILSARTKISLALCALLAFAIPVTADFNDNQYHEVVLFHWDTTHLDVLIVPPAATAAMPRLAAVEGSIDAWADGIAQLGESWLASGLTINRTTLPAGLPPSQAMSDPEVIVLSAEVNPVLLFGIGAPYDYLVCDTIDGWFALATSSYDGEIPEDATLNPAWHQHETSPWAVMNARCADNTDNVCVVVNTNFALNREGQQWMYDLNAHEFGHCLGIGHVGDANDFEAKTYPEEDIMSYQHTSGQPHCVSTLNMRALEGAMATVFGRPSSEVIAPFDYAHMDPSQYSQVQCSLTV